MRRTIIALAMVLPACGDSTEAKLERCKAEMKAELQRTLATARQEADKQAKALLKPGDPVAKEAMEQLKKMNEGMRDTVDAAAAMMGPALDAEMKKLHGATGLAECEKAVAFLRTKRGP
jgi:hypothetical protein